MKMFRQLTIPALTLLACITFSCHEAPDGSGPGCINPNAVNYNPDAAYDNGSCVVIEEKTYSLFFQYASASAPDCDDVNFNEVMSDNNGKVLGVRLPVGDSFSWGGNDSILARFVTKYGTPAPTLPQYGCNNTFHGANYNDANANITARFASAPEAGIGILHSVGGGINAGKLNINVYVKFFNPGGQYFLAMYVLHKNFIGPQNVGGTPVATFNHKRIAMASITPVFGNMIPADEVSAGAVYHDTYIFPYTDIPSFNINSYQVVGVIWKKTQSGFDVVNVTPNPY